MYNIENTNFIDPHEYNMMDGFLYEETLYQGSFNKNLQNLMIRRYFSNIRLD